MAALFAAEKRGEPAAVVFSRLGDPEGASGVVTTQQRLRCDNPDDAGGVDCGDARQQAGPEKMDRAKPASQAAAKKDSSESDRRTGERPGADGAEKPMAIKRLRGDATGDYRGSDPSPSKRARARTTAAGAVNAHGRWTCPVCTLINDGARRQCAACGEPSGERDVQQQMPRPAAEPRGRSETKQIPHGNPRFAHVELPHQKQHRYGKDDNARIAAARIAFAAARLPNDAVRLPDRPLPGGGTLRLEVRFGCRARGNEMCQVNLDTDNAREVVQLSDWAAPSVAAVAGAGAARAPRITESRQRCATFPEIDEEAAAGRAEILMYNGTVRNKNDTANIKHCAWHGDTGRPVQPGDNDALPVAILFKNVDGLRGAGLAQWIGALDNGESTALSPLPLIFSFKSEKSLCGTGDVGTILRGREVMAPEPCQNPPWCPDNGADAWGTPFKMSGFASGTQLGGNDQYLLRITLVCVQYLHVEFVCGICMCRIVYVTLYIRCMLHI